MGSSTSRRFSWRLPLVGLVGAVVTFDVTLFFGVGFVAVLVAFALTLVLLTVFLMNVWRKPFGALIMVGIFCLSCWLLFRFGDNLHARGRWLVQSRTYKAEVLAQPDNGNGELKHVEWEGWGFPGAGDTVVYVVFDPSDSLEPAARSGSPGRFSGLPCEVYRVRRLQARWYTTQFYTDTDWNHCS